MKIILLKDLKGKKRNDIVDYANGFANYLINSGQALPATADNIKVRDNAIKMAKEADAACRKEALNYANKIVNKTINISRSNTPKGTPSKAVTKADVVEILNKDIPTLTTKNLTMDVIKTFGFTSVGVSLYKDVDVVVKVLVEDSDASKSSLKNN